MNRPVTRRKLWLRLLRDRVMVGLSVAALACALVPLAWVLGDVVVSGAPGLSREFLTQLPQPPTRGGGGWANAFLGTGIVVGLALLLGVPVGVGAGIYVAEFGDGSLGRATRFVAEVLAGIPSIIAGVVAYGIIVTRMGRFSALAGGVALAILVVPIVMITTEEALRLVPRDRREAAFALGVGEAPTTLWVVVPAAAGNILTGILVATARIAGETAPLLFTALGSRFWPEGVDRPIATVAVNIYSYAISPFPDWHGQARAGAFLLLAAVLLGNVVARLIWARRAQFMAGH